MSCSAKNNEDPAFLRAEQTALRGNDNSEQFAEANLPNLPSGMWASYFRGMTESLRANQTENTIPKATTKTMKPSDVYIPSFDPDDCEFTAAQWCEEIDHHRTQNAWTDYQTRNAAFTHLRGRARRWVSKSYPLCKTWDEAKERLTRQFAATKRFHDLFRDMVQYTSDKAATYVEYSTNKLAMVDRLESGWSQAGVRLESGWSEVYKIEVVISGIVDNQINEAWDRISAEMEIPVDVLKKKKETLMAAFRLNHKKKLASLKTGDPRDVFNPIWIFYDPMAEFLSEVYDFRSGNSYSDDGTSSSMTFQEKWNPVVEIGVEELSNDSLHDGRSAPKRHRNKSPEPGSASASETHLANTMTTLANVMNVISNEIVGRERDKDTEDECDLYGRLTAMKLRDVPEAERRELMYEIDTIFIQRRFKKEPI